MPTRHLCRRVRQDQRERRAKDISKNDGRPRETDGDIAPQEQTRTDGAADGNHGQLALGQFALQMLGWLGRIGSFFATGRSARHSHPETSTFRAACLPSGFTPREHGERINCLRSPATHSETVEFLPACCSAPATLLRPRYPAKARVLS